MDKDTFVNLLGDPEFHTYISTCNGNIQKSWFNKITEICTGPYVKTDSSTSLGAHNAFSLIKNFESEIFTNWPSYSNEQKAYLWCFSLEAIECNIQQFEFLSLITDDNESRNASDEHANLFRKYLDQTEFERYNTITSIFNSDPNELFALLKSINDSDDTAKVNVDFELV